MRKDTTKIVKNLNESVETDYSFGEAVYVAWLDFIGEETDETKLLELANEFMAEVRSHIEDDRGQLLHN